MLSGRDCVAHWNGVTICIEVKNELRVMTWSNQMFHETEEAVTFLCRSC